MHAKAMKLLVVCYLAVMLIVLSGCATVDSDVKSEQTQAKVLSDDERRVVEARVASVLHEEKFADAGNKLVDNRAKRINPATPKPLGCGPNAEKNRSSDLQTYMLEQQKPDTKAIYRYALQEATRESERNR